MTTPSKRIAQLEAWTCPVDHGTVIGKFYAQDWSYVVCRVYVGTGAEARECGQRMEAGDAE